MRAQNKSVRQHVSKSLHDEDLPFPMRSSPTNMRKEDVDTLKTWSMRNFPTFGSSHIGPMKTWRKEVCAVWVSYNFQRTGFEMSAMRIRSN